MSKRMNARLIHATLAVAVAVAALSAPRQTARYLRQAASLVFTSSVSESAIAAGALGDVRYLDVPPD